MLRKVYTTQEATRIARYDAIISAVLAVIAALALVALGSLVR